MREKSDNTVLAFHYSEDGLRAHGGRQKISYH